MDWTIGTVAHLAGINVETVRYYERIGLVQRPRRKPGSNRKYPVEALEQVRFVKRAQWLGFSLDEVAKLLSFTEGDPCCQTRGLGKTKLDMVRHKLDELIAVQAILEALLLECAKSSGDHCPLLGALRGNKEIIPCRSQRAPPAGLSTLRALASQATSAIARLR